MSVNSAPDRVLVVWCPDWPVVAHQLPSDDAVAVFHANRVVACSPVARAHGVARHMVRREAQRRCPQVRVLDRDLGVEARAFEQVVLGVEQFAARLEILRPGLLAFPVRGPARYFGGEEMMCHRVLEAVDELMAGWGHSRIGVAEGPFAARLAARHADATGVRLVPKGDTPAFLAPLRITSLESSDLAGVLIRLGIQTLGDFAALAATDVLGRFGAEGAWAHRLARGVEERPLSTSKPPADLQVIRNMDPPLERVDQAAFLGKAMADELHERLMKLAAVCSQVVIVAHTEQGEVLERCWRHEGALSAAAIADRIRWQLDGWLTMSPAARRTSGVTRLVLRPNDIMAAKGRQLGFWGERTEAADRVIRAVARLQGLLGTDQVRVPERKGGRSPHEQLVLVPADAVDLDRETVDRHGHQVAPWPGQLGHPAPGQIHQPGIAVQLLNEAHEQVGVSGRGLMNSEPRHLLVQGDHLQVQAWAGPWPLEERWWDAERVERCARVQVMLSDGVVRLLSVRSGSWQIDATYD